MSKNAPITAQTPLPAPAPSHDELGPLVGKSFGGYEVTSYIGEGATGAVYRAEDLMGERMAVKVMHRELSRKEHSEKLWHDLQALNALEDDHFVRVYDCGFGEEGEFFYTMDELTGVDLESALEESGALAPRRAVEIVEQLCAAIARAHKAGVVHGGLKPRNVFLCPVVSSGEGTLVVKVLDFGAARLAGGVDKGVIVGNPFYMAPEQFGGHADERTDVYSLGVLMYELFSGTLPFNGPTHGQVMMRHLAEPPAAPPGVDPLLARIILKALKKAQSDRFSSVDALHKALSGWAKGARTLEDAAASHVIARASQARKVKQAALTTPDATAPMGKIDVTELANATRQQLEPAKTPRGSGNGMQTTTRKEDTQNSPESVEASLEDFISQANATFPTSDGWDLHTGDVELVDDEPDDEARLEQDEHVSAPIVVKPRKSEPSGQVRKSDRSARMRKAASATPAHAHSKMDETPLPPPKAQTTMVDSGPNQSPSKRRGNPFEPSIALDLGEEAEPLDPPPTGPKRRAERTEVVSSPLPRVVPWTANPIVWVGGMFAAFVAGSVLVFTMVKAMMPVQQPPVVVQQAAPAAPQPAAAAPVVTPLGASRAAAPVVTPLDAPRAPTPEEVPPTMAQEQAAQAQRPVRHAAAKHVAAPAHVAAAPAHVAAAPKRAHAAAAASDDDDDEAPAAPKKAKKEGKAAKGADWVDPFAQ
jgi:serine/threonine protein kinase